MSFSADTLKVLAKLRPPFSRTSLLLYSYALEGPKVNDGITVQVPAGEAAIAPGAGTVSRIWSDTAAFYTEDVVLLNQASVNITIDHGQTVRSTIGGLSSTALKVGQYIRRGATLGQPKAQQVFLKVEVSTNTLDPCGISKHFNLQDANAIHDGAGTIRFAPDVVARDLTAGSVATQVGHKRYFDSDSPFLVNIDFNGNAGGYGAKIGPAMVGVGSTDFWNVYDPAEFSSTDVICDTGHGYSYGSVYSNQPYLLLRNYDGTPSVAVLQRVPPLVVTAGTCTSFDVMLRRFVGAPALSNTFNLRNVPQGDYILYVYSYTPSPAFTEVYASANGDAPVHKTVNNNSVPATWTESVNYVAYPLTVGTSGKVSLAVYGYLSGLQLIRTGA